MLTVVGLVADFGEALYCSCTEISFGLPSNDEHVLLHKCVWPSEPHFLIIETGIVHPLCSAGPPVARQVWC